MNEQRRKWPWFEDPRRENHGLSRNAAAKRLFGVTRALPLAAFSVPRRSFREHGPWQRQTAEKTRKANRGAAHPFRPAIKGAAFHPATGVAEGSPPHPCPAFQEEQPQLRRRQRPVMRGAAAVSWRHHRQEWSKFELPLMPRKKCTEPKHSACR